MSDGFYAVTNWLPTYKTIVKDGKQVKVDLDTDLSSWVEHLKQTGLQEGRDFEVRKREDGKRAIFRRGKSPFQDTDKYYPHSSRSNGR